MEKDTRWSVVLENRGLLHVADVLQKYGIDTETEVSELEYSKSGRTR
jgi:hypothetical protein